MSKIAEKKALEAYPIKEELVGNQYGGLEDTNSLSREKYQEGYDQAMKDIQGQAEKSVIEKSNGEVTIEDLVAYNQGFKTGRNLTMQDFLEKAERFIEDTQIENFICRDDGIYFDNEKLIEQFKNYMKNEIQD